MLEPVFEASGVLKITIREECLSVVKNFEGGRRASFFLIDCWSNTRCEYRLDSTDRICGRSCDSAD